LLWTKCGFRQRMRLSKGPAASSRESMPMEYNHTPVSAASAPPRGPHPLSHSSPAPVHAARALDANTVLLTAHGRCSHGTRLLHLLLAGRHDQDDGTAQHRP
jgi:hypothetical protein